MKRSIPLVTAALAGSLACAAPPTHDALDLAPALVRPAEGGEPWPDLVTAGYRAALLGIDLEGGRLTWGAGGRRDFEHDALAPLLEALEDVDEPFLLLIAISDRSEQTYAALEAALHRYREVLTTYESGEEIAGRCRIVLAGAVPLEVMAHQRTRYAFAAAQPATLTEGAYGATLVPLVRARYQDVLDWNGEGPIPERERLRVQALTTRAHLQGRKVSIHSAPAEPAVWDLLLVAGVDYIEVPEPGGSRKLVTFLEGRRRP